MNANSDLDYLIIGAGPAGLQLGYFLEKANRNYLILEAGDSPGSSFQKFPRHGKLISINKVYTGYEDTEINLRWDWNSLLNDSEAMLFKNYSRQYFPNANDLVKYLSDFATYFNLKVKYDCQVIQIKKDNKFIVIDRSNNIYSASRLIIATGLSKPYIPQISGIELAENYVDVSINPENFINQKVLIIGKGNSGFETADNLIDTAAMIHIASQTPISMAWKTKYVGHLRAVNNNFLDTYQLKSQNAVLDAQITKIERHQGRFIVSFSYTHANGEEEEIVYDRVIVCTGFRFDDSIFDESCKPELAINNRFPAQTSEWESINIKGLYFIGVLSHMRDFKKKQSGFIHGFRYNIRSLQKILNYKYHNQELPYQLLSPTPQSLTEAIFQRVNTSSGLWQQTGFLCDIIVISEPGKSARYYQELPKDYIHDSEFGKCKHYYTISLEFGYEVGKNPDPFAVQRVHKNDAINAEKSAFIHPIIRRFCGNTLIQEHHVIEDLAAEWLEDVHVIPLLEFFKVQLSEKLESSLVNENERHLPSEMLSLALVE
ncbi:NAD(P)-binding domain-containing protein [Tolypothrix sp. FACHB-123]|uniref:NAD(P)-binding domain-containing protein n=1 Tax=Tolypothrix sp. FACHB-123 TaxID=2692868 RepID=UPI001686BB5E|nr:NAD(P)-binding domain-containing protein [Tolypothrix sp. FACHB-123]MBD2355545.1 NAD(P)-binding domain-containing protein [Tolypothrix sp. FACHB-123]